METLIAIARGHLEPVDRLQYLELVDGDTLSTVESPLRRPAALCAAAYVGSTRHDRQRNIGVANSVVLFKAKR